ITGEFIDGKIAASATIPNFETKKHVREVHVSADPVLCRFREKWLQIDVAGSNGTARDERDDGRIIVSFRPLTTRSHPNVVGLTAIREVSLITADWLSVRRIVNPDHDETIN